MSAARRTFAAGCALAFALAALAGCGELLGFDQSYGSQSGAAEAGSAAAAGEDAATSNAADAANANPNMVSSAAGDDAATGAVDSASPLQGSADATSGAPDIADASTPADTGAATDDAGPPPAVSPLLALYAGSTTLAADASVQTVTLPTIDPSRAFVVAGTTFDVTPPTDFEVTSQIASATEAVFTRTGSSGAPAIPVQYYVAEFQSGVEVLRGSTTMSATSVSVALSSAVDLANSFPLVTYRNTGTNWGEDDFVQAKLTSASQLSLGINLAAPDGIAEWQVVSFPGATVQSGDLAMTATDTEVSGTIPQAVTLGATWLVFSNQPAGATGTTAELLLSGHLSSSTQVTFSRAAGGATQQITWYAVSFTNGTAVQSASLTLADTATTATATLNPVDVAKSIAVSGGVWRQGGTSAYTGASSPGFGTYRLSLESSTALAVTRGASGTATQSDLDYSVIQFF